MLNDAEAFAILLSLKVAQRTAFQGAPLAIEGALAKIERVIPESLAQQLHAMQATLNIELALPETIPSAVNFLLDLSRAIHFCQAVTMTHASFHGEVNKRTIYPYGLVYRVGRWYIVGYCCLREAIRTFRIDRIQALTILDTHFVRPDNFEALPYVEQALASTPGIHHVKIWFGTSLAEVQKYISPAMGTLTDSDNGILFEGFFQQITWFAGVLMTLPFPIKVLQPETLKTEIRKIQSRQDITY